MKRYTYSQARQHLSEILDIARKEDVLITRRGWRPGSSSMATHPDCEALFQSCEENHVDWMIANRI